MVLGAGIALYPTFSDWWNNLHASRSIASYMDSVENMTDYAKIEMLEKAEEYNKRLEKGVHFNLDEEATAEYESLLDVNGSGIMGYVTIPSINVYLPIYHGTSESVLQVAAGHISGSSLPVGGKGTHCIISGHRGLPSAKLFSDLDELKEGDIFTLTVLEKTYTYLVDQIRIVLPEETQDLEIDDEHDYCTLVTCTPYGINSHRMLVRGHRTDNLAEEKIVEVTAEAVKVPTSIVIFAVVVPLLVILLVVSLVVSAIKKPKKSEKQMLEELRKR